MEGASTPTSPPDNLRPQTKEEVQYWNKWVAEGWAEGEKQAVEIFLADKKGQDLSKVHIADLKAACNRFADAHGAIHVREVDEAMVRRFLLSRQVSARTIRNEKLSLMNFLNYAKRRKWLKEAPEIHQSDLPKEKKSPKGVLTVEESAGGVAWMEEHRPEYIPWLAVQAFAGIRWAAPCFLLPTKWR